MRQGIHRSRTAGLFLLAAMLFSASVSAAGPVILGGDDLTQHGSRSVGGCTADPPTGTTVAETEPNDTFGTADPIALGDDYAGAFVPFAGDSDFLSFAATGAETLFVSYAGDSFFAVLTLYETDGVTVVASELIAAGGPATFTVPGVAGTYFLELVELFIFFGGGPYTLEVRACSPTGPVLLNGWRYIQRALENLAPSVTVTNDGSVAVLGSADSTADFNAGAAYHFAVPLAAATTSLSGGVTFHNGAAAINQFFTDLAAGNVDPAIIVSVGTGAANDQDSSEVAAMTANALGIANFVNAGGGLLSHGSDTGLPAYGWLSSLIPGASAPSDCQVATLTLTAAGQAAFPGLTNSDIQAGPCHTNFLNHGLPVLARDGVGRDIIIGGAAVTLPGQLTLDPSVGFNSPGASHTVTANVTDANSNPLQGIDVDFLVTSGPNVGDNGTDVTNGAGDALFTYNSNGVVGLDVIEVSFVDPAGGNTIVTTARKYWDFDCQPNGIPDTCDVDCFALQCAADFTDCGGSSDDDGNGQPDECIGAAPGQPPTVTCPVASDFQCDSSPPQATVSLTVQINDADGDELTVTWLVDNVSVQTDFVAAGSSLPTGVSFNNAIFGLGVHTVEVIVDDGTETDSCTVIMTVVDTIPPVAFCLADVTVDTDPGVCLASGVALGQPQVSENCQVDTVDNDAPVDFDLGSTIVTWTVTDVGGNSATCEQIVTVEDVELPTAICSSDVIVPTDAGLCSATVIIEELAPAVSDNCGIASVTNNAPAPFPLGTTTVTWTVTDESGNTTECTQTVTVEDRESPVVTCSVFDNMLGEDDVLWPPNHTLEAVGLNVDVSDNCDGDPVIAVVVFADEDDEEATGDGTHSPDAKDIASGTLRLRKERKGDADGRVYLIVGVAVDFSGNVGFSCCTVTVPHSRSPSDKALVEAQAAAAEAECLATGLVPAGFVVVGDGAVIGPKQ